MKSKKFPFILLIALLLISTIGINVFAVISTKNLACPNVKQEKSNWCWAGSSLSILNHFYMYTDQQTFVTYVQTGKTAPINASNIGATDADVLKGLNYFGASGSIFSGALSFSSVQNQLLYNYPIWTHISWLDSTDKITGGHAVVIDKYYSDSIAGDQEITYMDPWDGAHYTMSYSSFVYTAHDQKWTSGISNITKK